MQYRHLLVLSLVILALVTTGCETMGDKTKKGAAIGAITGAAAGGIIGHQDGHGWEGALIGAAAGGTMGGVIGHQMDKKQKAVNPQHISLPQVAEMINDGTPDSVIISELKRTKSAYKLDSEIISWLKSKGASDRLIDYMLSTG